MSTFDVARAAAFAATLLVLGTACDDAATPASTGSAQAMSSARPPASVTTAQARTTPTAATAPDDDIPTSADFEIEAAKDIHASNVETELATLEKEITADK